MATVHVEAAVAGMPAAVPSARPAGLLMKGAASGLLAGAVMAGTLMLAASSTGMDVLHPMRAIGATFVGPEALQGDMGIVAYGALLHATMSIAFGLLFVAVFPVDLRPLEAVVIGSGYAMFVLGFMAAAVVPSANGSFRVEMQPIGGAWVTAHALYGCALALVASRLGGRRSAGAGPDRADRP